MERYKKRMGIIIVIPHFLNERNEGIRCIFLYTVFAFQQFLRIKPLFFKNESKRYLQTTRMSSVAFRPVMCLVKHRAILHHLFCGLSLVCLASFPTDSTFRGLRHYCPLPLHQQKCYLLDSYQ